MTVDSIRKRVQAMGALSLAGDQSSVPTLRSHLYRDTLEHIVSTSDDPVTRLEAETALQAENATWEPT